MWTCDPKRVFVWRMRSPSKHEERATREYSATSGNLRLLGERGTGHTSLLSHWFDEWASPSGRGGGEGEAKTVFQWEDILPGRDTPTPHCLQTFQQTNRTLLCLNVPIRWFPATRRARLCVYFSHHRPPHTHPTTKISGHIQFRHAFAVVVACLRNSFTHHTPSPVCF